MNTTTMIIISLLILLANFILALLTVGITNNNSNKEEYKDYEINEILTDRFWYTYKVMMRPKGDRMVLLYLRTKEKIDKINTQLVPLLMKLEAEDKIQNGVYELNTEEYTLTEISDVSIDDIERVELKDIYNRDVRSVKDNNSCNIHID